MWNNSETQADMNVTPVKQKMLRIFVILYILSTSYGFRVIEQEIFKFDDGNEELENQDDTDSTGDVSTALDYTEMTTGEEITSPDDGDGGDNDDDGGLSGGEIAAIVIGSMAGVAVIGGAGYFFYSKRAPGEDLTFSSLHQNDMNSYGAAENGTNAHSNLTYDYIEDKRSSNYLPEERMTGTFKSTSM